MVAVRESAAATFHAGTYACYDATRELSSPLVNSFHWLKFKVPTKVPTLGNQLHSKMSNHTRLRASVLGCLLRSPSLHHLRQKRYWS